MKSRYVLMSSILLTCLGNSVSAAELIAEIQNLQQIKGSLYLSVYKDAQSFDMNSNFIKREKIIVDQNIMEINLGNLPSGDYAIRVYQDVNNNGKMDFHGMLPAEPFGASGKSDKNMPPNFNSAKFSLSEPRKILIQLVQ